MPTDERCPSKLYKYRVVNDFTRNLVVKGEIFFACPSSLNDPYDCNVTYSVDCSEEEFRRLVAANYIGLGDLLKSLPMTIRRKTAIKHLYRIREQMITDEAKISLGKFIERTGIFCLAESPRNQLMWSHYAESHKGICVEFCTGQEPQFFENAAKISYGSDFPTFECFCVDERRRAMSALCRKSLNWSYEQEWRLIWTHGARKIRQLAPGVISRVILGAKMSEKDKKIVKEWCEASSSPPQLQQATISPGTDDIGIEDVEISNFAP